MYEHVVIHVQQTGRQTDSVGNPDACVQLNRENVLIPHAGIRGKRDDSFFLASGFWTVRGFIVLSFNSILAFNF